LGAIFVYAATQASVFIKNNCSQNLHRSRQRKKVE